jgi:hypothetical protein
MLANDWQWNPTDPHIFASMDESGTQKTIFIHGGRRIAAG